VTRAHDEVRRALVGPDPAYQDAIALLSGHLAALEREVYPLARRLLPEHRHEIALQLRHTQELERLLRALQQRVNGDSLAMEFDLATLHRQLLTVLERHAGEEHELLEELHGHASAEQWQRFVGGWQAAVAHAPTRPHPHVPHRGWAERMAFWFTATWDRLLDAADARIVPGPRQEGPRQEPGTYGRWGYYRHARPWFAPGREAGSGTAPDQERDASNHRQ
jgi:hypothetical protein